MTSQEMARALARLADELERLFDDELWSERAEAGVDRDDDANPQRSLGCALGDLRDASRGLEAAPTTHGGA